MVINIEERILKKLWPSALHPLTPTITGVGCSVYREPNNIPRVSDAKMHMLCVQFRCSREMSRQQRACPPRQSQTHPGQKHLLLPLFSVTGPAGGSFQGLLFIL